MIKIGDQIDQYNYSICTLVTRMDEYIEMKSSFQNAGFNAEQCEYLFIDNTQDNTFDGYSGLNRFLIDAKGTYIIFCHQDILLSFDNRAKLETLIDEIEKKDSNWAVISNAGALGIKNIIYRVTEPGNEYAIRGTVPSRVQTVDESFIVIKRSANLSVSRDLSGFHLYGTDLCLIASLLGYSSWVVDFNLIHKSKGNVNKSFRKIKVDLISKYNYFMRPRYIQTTNTNFLLSSNLLLHALDHLPLYRFFVRQYFKWKFRKVSTNETRTIIGK